MQHNPNNIAFVKAKLWFSQNFSGSFAAMESLMAPMPMATPQPQPPPPPLSKNASFIEDEPDIERPKAKVECKNINENNKTSDWVLVDIVVN